MKKITNEQKQITKKTFDNNFDFVGNVSRCNFDETIENMGRDVCLLNNRTCISWELLNK